MKIIIGADHRGYKLKSRIIPYLKQKGYIVEDIGTDSYESVDDAKYAFEVGERVSKKEFDFGVLICGSGLGMVIAANKVKGIRAVNPRNVKFALMARQHNDANVLVFDSDMFLYKVKDIIDDFFMTDFYPAERYIRRNKMMADYEGSKYER